MKRFLKKALRWTAIIFATLAVLLLVFYAEEDWRGARDWAACQRDLAAQGETLDLRQLIPPGNPADDLSKVPIFAELYKETPEYLHEYQYEQYIFHWRHEPQPARMNKISLYLDSDGRAKRPEVANLPLGKPADFGAWQKFYLSLPQAGLSQRGVSPVQDILKILERFDPDLRDIDDAVSKSGAYWPIDYNKPFLSNLDGVNSMNGVAEMLTLRGMARLENHQVDLAEEDYFFLLRLCQPLAKGCLVANYNTTSYCSLNSETILWEGLRRHAWSDTQLHKMESALASLEFLELATRTLRIERACGVAALDFIQKGNYDELRAAGGVTEFDKYGYYDALRILSTRPEGEWDQDKCFYCQAIQKRLEGIQLHQGTLDATLFNVKKDQEIGWSWRRQYVYFSMIEMPVIDRFGEIAAQAETYRRLVRLACRLEEYRIAHGQYPDKLQDLPDLPAHLNQEVLSEQPLQYHRKGDGYQLYSLGWDQKDDGGTYNSADPKQGDWPWPSP